MAGLSCDDEGCFSDGDDDDDQSQPILGISLYSRGVVMRACRCSFQQQPVDRVALRWTKRFATVWNSTKVMICSLSAYLLYQYRLSSRQRRRYRRRRKEGRNSRWHRTPLRQSPVVRKIDPPGPTSPRSTAGAANDFIIIQRPHSLLALLPLELSLAGCLVFSIFHRPPYNSSRWASSTAVYSYNNNMAMMHMRGLRAAVIRPLAWSRAPLRRPGLTSSLRAPRVGRIGVLPQTVGARAWQSTTANPDTLSPNNGTATEETIAEEKEKGHFEVKSNEAILFIDSRYNADL